MEMERIISLSDQERRYIVEGVRNNIRLDGRHRLESRPFAVETSVVPAANGSARVILNGCEVIVGIKAEVVQPVLERPTEGVVDCQVECSSNVTAEVSASRGQIRDLNAELSAALKRLYSSEFNQNALNLKDLCIIPGKSCWAVHIDAIVLSMDGSILDCLSFAVRAALYSTL